MINAFPRHNESKQNLGTVKVEIHETMHRLLSSTRAINKLLGG